MMKGERKGKGKDDLIRCAPRKPISDAAIGISLAFSSDDYSLIYSRFLIGSN